VVNDMNRYTLKKMEDKVWVDVKPLMNDVHDVLNMLSNIDTSKLSEEDVKQLDLQILGMKSITVFLGGLLSEYEVREQVQLATEAMKNVNIQTIH